MEIDRMDVKKIGTGGKRIRFLIETPARRRGSEEGLWGAVVSVDAVWDLPKKSNFEGFRLLCLSYLRIKSTLTQPVFGSPVHWSYNALQKFSKI